MLRVECGAVLCPSPRVPPCSARLTLWSGSPPLPPLPAALSGLVGPLEVGYAGGFGRRIALRGTEALPGDRGPQGGFGRSSRGPWESPRRRPLRPIAHTPTLTQTYPRNYAVSRYSICRVPSLHRPQGQILPLLGVGQRAAAGSSSVGAPGVILLARIPDPGFSHGTPAPGGGVCAGDQLSRPKTEMGRAPENARPATEETEQ